MITVTAPGVDVLPWDRSRCKLKRRHRCEGPAGCVVHDEAADAWSADASARWAKLRQAARVAAKRATPHKTPPRLLGRVWEPQKRGVPHVHVVVDCSTAELLEAAEAFRSALARLAPAYGFGRVDKDINPHGPEKAAGYVADYLTGRQRRARVKKTSIRENIADPRMPRSLLWMTPQLTRVTRVTMRTLRYVGWYWAAVRGRCDVLPRLFGEKLQKTVQALITIESNRRRGPPLDESEARLRHVRNLRLMRQLQPAYDWRTAA